MDILILSVALIGFCLLLVSWQEFRTLNRRDGRLAAYAGTSVVLGSVAAWIMI